MQQNERPRWGFHVLAAAVALVLAAGAAASSAAMLVRPAPHAVHTVIVPPTAPTYSAADASAAKSRACAAWEVTSSAMAQASRGEDTATAPSDWTDPQTRAAHGYEARSASFKALFLEVEEVGPATRQTGRDHDYLVATFDQEDATMRRVGSQVNAAVDRSNAAVDRVDAACDFA